MKTINRIDHYTVVHMIGKFNELIGLKNSGSPKALDRDSFDSRYYMIEEELGELYESFHGGGYSDAPSLEKMADAFGDIMFVAMSGLIAMGVDPLVAIMTISMSNMSKVEKEGTDRSPTGDAEKGAAYKGPGWNTVFILSMLMQAKIDRAILEIQGLSDSPGIDHALALRSSKQSDYGSPEDYAVLGLPSFLHEVYKKALRAVRLCVLNDGVASNESMIDSLADLINWADYAYKLVEDYGDNSMGFFLPIDDEDPIGLKKIIEDAAK